MRLSTVDFSIEPLQPFGERWTHGKGEPLMVESLTHEPEALAAVVREVRRAGVLVIKNTRTDRDWEPIVEDPRDLTSSIAHVDSSGYGSPATLHLLHAKEGRSSPTAYAKRTDLTRAMKDNLTDLATLVEEAVPWVRENYRLDELLEYCRHPEARYDFGFLHPHTHMGRDFETMRKQLSGREWLAGQNLTEIREKEPALAQTYGGLLHFYQTVSRKNPAYVHNWEPGDTVLAYQDPEHQYEPEDPRIFHFNAGDGTYSDRRILHRDIALRLEDRRGSSYKTSSAIRAEQRSWY